MAEANWRDALDITRDILLCIILFILLCWLVPFAYQVSRGGFHWTFDGVKHEIKVQS